VANGNDDAETAVGRLEAALERIARLAQPPAPTPVADMPDIRDRLDRMIERVRSALDVRD
jgi:hypothetical protein